MTYFFMFSTGSYSDYSVGGLYSCDHEVTEAEWDAHYKIFQDEASRLSREINANGKWKVGDPYYEAYRKYRKEHNPEESFQKLHNMQHVGVTEFWRDC